MGRGGSWGILSAEASPDTQRGPTPAFLAPTVPLSPGQPLRPCALPGPAAAGEEGRRSRPSGAAGASSHRKSVKIFWDSGPRGCDPRLGPCSPRSLGRCRPGLGVGEGVGAAQPRPSPRSPTQPPQGQQACFWSGPSARPAAGHLRKGGLSQAPRALWASHRLPDVGNPDAHPQGVETQEGTDGERGTWRAPGSGETLGPGQPQTQSCRRLPVKTWCSGHVSRTQTRRCSDGSEAGLPGAPQQADSLTGPPGTECPGGSLKALECHVLGLKGKQHNL